MVTDQDLQMEQDHQALVEELPLECAKYGTLTSMRRSLVHPMTALFIQLPLKKYFWNMHLRMMH
jgi:hypothetical protein